MAGASAAYEAAGVNLEAGDNASDAFYNITQQSWRNRADEFGEPKVLGEGFRGARGVDLGRLFELKEKLPDLQVGRYSCADGVGNKPRVAERVDDFSTIGIDLAAMVVDDAAAAGAEPIGMTNILVVNTLGKKSDHPNKKERIRKRVIDLATGHVKGANQSKTVIENGEIAEHGDHVGGYGEFRIDWTAVANYMFQPERIIDGKKIKAGAAVVALADEGFGCNGYSLLLKTLEQVHGHEWHHVPFDDRTTWGEEALRPTQIYAGLFTELTGGWNPERAPAADVQTLVHNTGGGIPGKFGSKLKGTGLGVELDDLFELNPAMGKLKNMQILMTMTITCFGGQRGLW
jgi:phosphoribosylformylglycinamidine cyclo-ligase